MAINIGDSIGGGTARSILFVGPTGLLAQDNTNFRWDVDGIGLNVTCFPADSALDGSVKIAFEVVN